MQRFIVQLVTEPKVKNSCVLMELEDESVSDNSLAPTVDTQTILHSAVLEVSEDEEVENTPPGNLTPCRRRRKPRRLIDVKLLCRSPRLNPNRAGFHTQEAADAAALFQPVVNSDAAARDGPAPFLPLQIVQGIGENFLQMNPEDLSEEALTVTRVTSDNEEVA